MTVISVRRPQTAAEALGPVVEDLFAAIDQSKKLRGERLQVESVFKSLDSLGEEATPEEKMAAARGALQQVRTQARDQNEGFLARIIKGLDPRVPSFGEGVTPIEKFVADQQLGIAFSDNRLLDSQIELNKQRAAELERRPGTGGAGGKRFGVTPWYLSPENRDTPEGKAALSKSLEGSTDLEALRFWQGIMNNAAGDFFNPTLEGGATEPDDPEGYEFARKQFLRVKNRIEKSGAVVPEQSGNEFDPQGNPIIRTTEQYNNLKIGDKWVDANGQLREKVAPREGVR